MKMNEKKQNKNISPSNLSERVLGKIESGETKVRPHSYFVARNYLLWSVAVAAVLLGAFSVSSIIFRLSNFHLLVHKNTSVFNNIETAWELVPLIWFVAFGLFAYLAYEEVRATKQGYKYKFSTLLLAMMVASVVLGFAFYSIGSGYVLDKMAARYVPFHPDVEMLGERAWERPQAGFIAGEIVEVSPESFILSGPDDSLWRVEYSEMLVKNDKDLVQVGRRIGVMGGVLEESEIFIACSVSPLEVRGKGRLSPKPNSIKDELRKSVGERNNELLRIKDCKDVYNLR